MPARFSLPTKGPPVPSFRGKLWFLSNFYPVHVHIGGIEFPTAEHAYVWFKVGCPEDFEAVLKMTPGKAKQWGKTRAVEKWEGQSMTVMRDILRFKFTQNLSLANRLLETNKQDLVERNNWHDLFWGVCMCQTHKGQGANHLGQLLREIKGELSHDRSVLGGSW